MCIWLRHVYYYSAANAAVFIRLSLTVTEWRERIQTHEIIVTMSQSDLSQANEFSAKETGRLLVG